MNTPIQQPSPINTTVTIQPVTTAIQSRDASPENPLSNIPIGTIVEGFVLNRDEQNNPIVRTAIGDFKVTSEVFLKTGSEVVFRVSPNQNSLANILTVDGLSPQEYNAQNNVHGLTEDTITSTGLQTAQTQAIALGAKSAPENVLQALVLQTQPAGVASTLNVATPQTLPLMLLTQLAQLTPGTPLRLQVLELKLPPQATPLAQLGDESKLSDLLPPRTTGPLPGFVPPQENTPNAPGNLLSNPPLLNEQPAVPANLLAQLAANQPEIPSPQHLLSQQALPSSPTIPLSVIAASQTTTPDSQTPSAAPIVPSPALPQTVQPAHNAAPSLPPVVSAPAATLPSASAPQAVTTPVSQSADMLKPTGPNQAVAQVIGHDADGGNILHTSFASLKLYTPQPLPTGTSLLVQPSMETTNPSPVETILPATLAPPSQPSDAIAVLRDALNWLSSSTPATAHEMQAHIPSISPRFMMQVITYINAARTGDVVELVGKRNLRALELDAPALFKELTATIGRVQRDFAETAPQQWLQMQLPVMFGQELTAVQLYLQRDPPEKQSTPKSAQDRGHRFVLELELSHLGAMQLDGFMRTQNSSKSFDLMVRTSTALPNEVSQGIREVFASSAEATGLTGQVIFQQGRQHFFKPPAAGAPRPTTPGANTILA